jgi:hypothetical protein
MARCGGSHLESQLLGMQILKFCGLSPAREKISENPFQQISQAWWYACTIPVMEEVLGRRIVI